MTAHEPGEQARRILAALLPHAVQRLAELLGSPDPVAAARARRVCARHRSTFGAMWTALATPSGTEP